jgi:transposase
MPKTKKRKELEYAVKYLYETTKMSISNIALELGVAEAIVDGIINATPEPTPLKKSKSQDLMIRHTSVKKTNNVSVMTEGASQLNDELKKNFGSTKSRTSKDSIFRPNG